MPALLLGTLVLLTLPGSAVAAECTDTWVGPAEGSWVSAANWSAGHVPGESDVACIPSGGSARMTAAGLNVVKGLQGGGALALRESTFKVLGTAETWWIGSLNMDYEANLTGPSTVEVRDSLAWESQSTMSGAGKTVLGLSSTTTLANANSSFTVSSRTVINEGTVSQPNYGTLVETEGGVFENLGTYTVNGEKSLWQIRSEGVGSTFINRGVFRKTEGSGTAAIASNFENAGTTKAATGRIKFEGEGRLVNFADGSNLEGTIACEKPSVTLGSLSAPGVELSFREDQVTVPSGKTASLGILRMDYHGNVVGPGTLEVTKALHWEGESSMSGGGKTILGPSSVNTLGSGNVWYSVSARTLVNEGTVAQASYGTLRLTEGGVFENIGTYTLNGEQSLWQILSAEPGSTFLNKGTFQKTEGTGTTKLSTSFENQGTINIASGEARFEELNHSLTFADGSHVEGKVVCEKTNVVLESFTAPNAEVSFREEPITIPAGKTVSIGGFTMRYQGNLSGAGTLEVTKSLNWAGESTMSGTGKTVLKAGTANVLDSGATTVNLSQRILVNEGTFTQTESSRLNLNAGATFKNRGTYSINSEPYPTWIPQVIRNEGGGSGRFVNSGQVQRTEGSLNVKVVPDFENQGVLNPKSSKIEIEHPESVKDSEKSGCKAGDPVSCATGNFTESQTDLAIGGRGVGLDLTRSYSAQAAAAATAPGIFGYGWTATFSDHLTIEEGGAKVTVTRGSGQTTPFTRLSGTAYAAPAWSQETLSGSPEAGYTFTALDQTQYRFSGTGRLESITDRNGNQMTLAYESGRLKTVTDPAGRTLTFAYNVGGQVESVTDPMGHVVKYGYEGSNLTSVTMPGEAAPRWQFAYDSSHRITQITNGRGGKTTNEYDASGRVTSQTDPAGRTLTFKYEGFHTTITNQATGAVTDEWFTSDNEPFQITHGFGTPQAVTETFSYDEGGRLLTRTDGLGHTTTYGYDEAGDRTSEKDPLSRERKWAFNATHDLISATTPAGETTTIKRDSHGNVESISRPAPGGATQTTSFKYGPHGELESLTDPLSRTWTYGYDTYGDRTSETDPLGQKQTLAYDKDSRLVAIVSPRGNAAGAKPTEYETKVERDLQGRPVKVTDPLGHSTSYTYDGNGNLASTTDAATHTTKYTYNADDERTKVEKPNGATLQTGYDGAGYVTSQTDGNGKTTTYVRNVLEQPVEVLDPLALKTSESFNAAGELAKLTDPSGRETTYSYDNAGQLTAVNYSDPATPDASFEYDADGNLTAITDGTGKSTFAYDQLGRLTKSQDGHGDVVEYAYDLGEEQTGITYPNGKAVSRAYDAAGRLESVTDWLGGKTNFTYDADSNLKNVAFPAASGNLDEYAYNRASQMSEARFKKGTETLASLTYTRDALGQVEKEARTGLPGPAETSFGYDANNRLTKAGSSTYEYDAADNLTAGMGSSNSYDAASELEKGTGASYTYDKEGERTSATNTLAEPPAFLRTFGGTGTAAGNLSAPVDTATDKEGNVWVADSGHNRVQEFNSKGEFVRQFGAKGTGNGEFGEMHGLLISGGNLYVAEASRIQEFNAKGEYLRKWGTLGFGNGQFAGLTDIATDPEGHLWTLEAEGLGYGARLQEFSAEGTYLAKFEYATGKETKQLNNPQALAIDAKGNFWVADTANNRLEEFNSKGEFVRVSGSEGTASGQFKSPRGVATDAEGNVWVADTANNRIQELSSSGVYLTQFGKGGDNNGQFSAPRGLTVDAAGNIWVADSANNRVEEIAAGSYVRQFGGTGSGAGNLSVPRDLATDKEGNVWVADTGRNRVQEFNSKGEFIRQFGAFGSANGEFKSPRGIAVNQATGNLYVADTANNRIQEFSPVGAFIRKWGSFGLGNGQFVEQQSLTVDAEGHVWTIEGGEGSARVQEFTSEGAFIRTFGKEGTESGQFKSPEAIATDAAGNVWVADTENNRIQEFKPGGEFIRKWGTAGTEAGQLTKPRGLAFDSEGKLWVADSGNDRLQRFTPEGSYLATFGSPGNNAGQFAEPRGLAIDAAGNIWVADTRNDRAVESTPTETLLTFGGALTAAGNLSAPRDLAADKEGNVWVADTAHNRVQEFSAEGVFIRQFGAVGTGNGMFSSPRAIAVNQATGNLYVADSGNRRVQEFSSKGAFIRKWGSFGFGNGQFIELQDLAVDAEGHVWTIEGGEGSARVQEFSAEGAFIRTFGKEGTEAGQFKAPEAIAADAAGNVWVADTQNDRIQEFKPSGELIRKWGTAGSAAGQLSRPRGLAFDAEGKLWVADSANDRLQRFTSEGAYLASFGSPGNNAGQLAEPRGVAIDANGNIWVADAANDRVVEWQSQNTTTYGYDQAGNLVSIQRPKAGANPAIAETLTYDATGLLASKTSSLATRYMAWDASTSLPLLLNDGENSYLYGPGGLPIEQISAAGTPTYLHRDQLGSTRMLTGSSGATTATFSYAPYGLLEAKTGTATTPLGFAGQYTEAETGLQYLRARFYDPGTGQFMTKDPLAELTRSPYGYSAENPVNALDPSGLCGASSVSSVLESINPISEENCAYQGAQAGAHVAASAAHGLAEGGHYLAEHGNVLVPIAVAGICISNPEACPAALAFEAGYATGENIRRAMTEPCFDFISGELRSLLVTGASLLPGGTLDATLSRTTAGSALTPLARRLVKIGLDAPGTILDVVHAESH